MKKFIKNHRGLIFTALLFIGVLGILPIVGLAFAGTSSEALGLLAGGLSPLAAVSLIGSIGTSGTYPDMTADGLNKLIPEMFSMESRPNLYGRLVLDDITNTDFTGQIKNQGDTVHIPTDPTTTGFNYKIGMLIPLEYLESPAISYTVDYARGFNFAVDDVVAKQSAIKDWLSRYGAIAAKDAKQSIEETVLGAIYADADTTTSGLTAGADADINLGVTGTPVGLSAATVTDFIADCAQTLTDNKVDEENRWMVIPPFMQTLLLKSEYKDASGTGMDKSAMLKGRAALLPIHGFTMYVSNYLAKDNGTANYHMLFGHKMAVSFVSQMNKVEKYRPDQGFSDALKGLTVYGFKTIQNKALGTACVKKA